MRFHARLVALVTALVAIAGCKKKEFLEREDDTAATRDLDAELREVRAELRALRAETRELRAKVFTEAEADEDPTPPVITAPDGGTAETPPDGVGKPPAQGNVMIQISSNPSGATVFLDEKILGKTPLLYRHPPGTEALLLRIDKPGFQPRLLTVRPDEDSKTSVQLARQK